MKILFVISSLSSGGAERVLSILANYFSEKYEVVIVTLSDETAFYPLQQRVKHICLDLLKSSSGIFDSMVQNLGRVRAFAKVFRQESPDVVISFMTHTNILALVAAKIARKKIIVAERTAYDYYNSKMLNLVRRFLYPLSDAVITQTYADKKNYDFLNNCHVIYNPIELRERNEQSSKEKIVLGVGRLDKQKGFDLLIKTFCNIGNKDWHLVIAGDGVERKNLENMIVKLRVSNVDLIGKTKEIFKWYEKASIFVLASQKEGFPNVLIEAMSMGCAVVSFDCPYGPSEIIKNGVNGVLVANQNQKQLEAAMKKLIEDENYRVRLGNEAKKVRERYSVKNIAAQWERVIQKVLFDNYGKRSE